MRVALALIFCLVHPGWSQESSSAADIPKQAFAARNAGQTEHSIAVYRIALPHLPELIGINALRLKMMPEEIPAEMQDRVRMAGRSVVMVRSHRIPEALKEAEALEAKYPKQANVHYLKGYLYQQAHSDKAIPEFKKELEISPGQVQARLRIAY